MSQSSHAVIPVSAQIVVGFEFFVEHLVWRMRVAIPRPTGPSRSRPSVASDLSSRAIALRPRIHSSRNFTRIRGRGNSERNLGHFDLDLIAAARFAQWKRGPPAAPELRIPGLFARKPQTRNLPVTEIVSGPQKKTSFAQVFRATFPRSAGMWLPSTCFNTIETHRRHSTRISEAR